MAALGKEWVTATVYNGTGSTMSAGQAVKLVTGGTGNVPGVTTVSSGDLCFGVVAEDILTLSYGRVVIQGLVQMTAGSGGITLGTQVMTDASGNAIAATSNKSTIGQAVTTTDAAAVGYVFVGHPFAWYEG